MPRIATWLTEALGIDYPIIGAPMFLVSTPELVAAVSNAGGLGSIPVLNFRCHEAFQDGINRINDLTDHPFGVNFTFKFQSGWEEDLAFCVDRRVAAYFTSLGNPRVVCDAAHAYGAKVFADVTNLKHARKAAEAGVDGLIAVGSGAGGHAGPTSLFALVPVLRQELKLPVIAAGAVSDGRGMAAALALGACAVHVGTRFIAATESGAPDDYRQLVAAGGLDDIVLTDEVTGVPCNFLTECLRRFREKKDGFKPWKDVWSAGQGTALISEVLPAAEIVVRMVAEYREVAGALP